MRFQGHGEMREREYTFYFGKEPMHCRESNVSLVVSHELVKKIASLPNGTSDGVMRLRLTLGHDCFVMLISVYAQ